MDINNLKGTLFIKQNNFSRYKHVQSHLLYGTPLSKEPEVSIIVPIYKRTEKLRETLNSCINQDYHGLYEIIVVDNNTDGIENEQIIRSINCDKILYYKHDENIGFEGNCNRGVELANGKYVSFCHDDDLLLPNCITILMGIQHYTKDKVITSAYQVIDANGHIINQRVGMYGSQKYIIKDWHNYGIYQQMLSSSGLHIGSLWNKKLFIDVGGYNPNFLPCQDYALHSIYTYYYGGAVSEIPTFQYRMAENASFDLYREFAPMQTFIMSEIATKIWYIPNFVKKIIISANYKNVKNASYVNFGKDPNYKWIKLTKIEKFTMYLAHFIPRHMARYHFKRQ